MEKKRNKKTVVKTKEIVDSNTGNILSTSMETHSFETEPEFVKLYIADIYKIHDLNASEMKLMTTLLSKMNYEAEIVLTTNMRREMIVKLQISQSTFKNSMGALKNKGIIMAIENNRYLLNPHLFGRGQWSNIKKIRLTIDYDERGRMIQRTNFDTQINMDFDEQINIK